MRIIIEMDSAGTAPQVSVQGREAGERSGPVAIDGGQPSAELLNALGADAGATDVAEPSSAPERSGAGTGGPEDGGSPPQWLVDVIEGSAGDAPP